jgi:hypothetical protein
LAPFFGFSASSIPENQGNSPHPNLEFRPNQASGFVPGTKADHFRQVAANALTINRDESFYFTPIDGYFASPREQKCPFLVGHTPHKCHNENCCKEQLVLWVYPQLLAIKKGVNDGSPLPNPYTTLDCKLG